MNNRKIIGLRDSRDNWFTCVDTAVLADKNISPTAKCVFAVLCMSAGFGHRSIIPNDEGIAELAGISVRALYKAFKELESRSLIFPYDGKIIINGHNAACYCEEDDER